MYLSVKAVLESSTSVDEDTVVRRQSDSSDYESVPTTPVDLVAGELCMLIAVHETAYTCSFVMCKHSWESTEF